MCRVLAALVIASVAGAGCACNELGAGDTGEGEGVGGGDPLDQPDRELIDEVAAEHADLADIEVAMGRGFWFETIFVYDPLEPSAAMGVRAIDLLADPFAWPEEHEPDLMTWGLTEEGQWYPEALGWYYAVDTVDDDGEAAPELFGVPMAGAMPGHVPFEGYHYDFFARTFEVPPPADDPYGKYNENLPTPRWYLSFESNLFKVWAYTTADARAEDGYAVELPCEAGEGGTTGAGLRNEEHYGELDPMSPDTLLLAPREAIDLELTPWDLPGAEDPGDILLGVQWTVPAAEVAEPPEMFGLRFLGPDANDEYTLRMWTGLANPDGYFAERHPLVRCPG